MFVPSCRPFAFLAIHMQALHWPMALWYAGLSPHTPGKALHNTYTTHIDTHTMIRFPPSPIPLMPSPSAQECGGAASSHRRRPAAFAPHVSDKSGSSPPRTASPPWSPRASSLSAVGRGASTSPSCGPSLSSSRTSIGSGAPTFSQTVPAARSCAARPSSGRPWAPCSPSPQSRRLDGPFPCESSTEAAEASAAGTRVRGPPGLRIGGRG